MSSIHHDIPVDNQPNGPQQYKCSYIPKEPGSYLLNIKWNRRPLKCCPLKISVYKNPEPDSSLSSPRSPTQTPRVENFFTPTDTPRSLTETPRSSVRSTREPASKSIEEILKNAVVGKPIILNINTKSFGPGKLS